MSHNNNNTNGSRSFFCPIYMLLSGSRNGRELFRGREEKGEQETPADRDIREKQRERFSLLPFGISVRRDQSHGDGGGAALPKMDDAQRRRSAPTDGAAASSASTSGADGDDNNAGGAKVWVLVLLFALLLLPFLPSAVRRGGTPWGGGAGSGNTGGGGGYRRGGINFKSGWDVVNLCLVLFAILCGLLGRGGGGDGEGESPSAQAAAAKEERRMSPAPTTEAVWESFGSFPACSGPRQQQHTGGIRRMKSSSSYPELRLGSDGVWALASPDAAWRFHDDAELYRARRPERQERTWDVHPQGRTPEVKTIPVDTFVERRGSPPREQRRRRRSVERMPNMAEIEEERPQQTMETATALARSRRWSAEVVDAIPEQQAAPVEVVAPLESPFSPPLPRPVPPRRRRGSLEKLPRPEELVDEVRNPSQQPQHLWRRRRSRSVENLPRPEELETEIVVEEVRNQPPSPPPAIFPPGTPPPPPSSTASRSKKKRNGSVGGAKEFASAIALFYQKKRKSITMKAKRRPHHHHHQHSDDHYSPPSSDASASPDATSRTTNAAPPPPPPPTPPPPPSSIFSNLFKKGSKSRRIQSVAPPHPPPPTRRSRKPPTPPSRSAPPAPTPPPVRTGAPRAHTHPQQQPMCTRRVDYTYYPLPPPSPALPPPPPPPPPLVSEGEEDAPSVTASPAPANCASPDVNAKADKFIESFREGLKLEKLNSYREKWQRQIQKEATVTVGEDEDGEFMVIGSLFGEDDDDDISLPETPATATVGF